MAEHGPEGRRLRQDGVHRDNGDRAVASSGVEGRSVVAGPSDHDRSSLGRDNHDRLRAVGGEDGRGLERSLDGVVGRAVVGYVRSCGVADGGRRSYM